MSHRVTTQTDMKDVSILSAICKKQNIAFEQSGNMVTFQGGQLRGATLNLTTGQMVGDSDVHGRGDTILGSLRQSYAHEMVRREALKNGVTIMSTETDRDGYILLTMSYGG